MAAAGANDEQGHAHAEPKGEQGGRAEHGVLAGADVDQRPRQRGGDAGRDH